MRIKNGLKVKFPVMNGNLFIEVNGNLLSYTDCSVTGYTETGLPMYAGIVRKQFELLTEIFPEILEPGFEVYGQRVDEYPSGKAFEYILYTASLLKHSVRQMMFLEDMAIGNLKLED